MCIESFPHHNTLENSERTSPLIKQGKEKPLHLPNLLIMSAPSGSGKTTILKRLLRAHPKIFKFSVSTTTRPRRRNERHGIDYYFTEKEIFNQQKDAGLFVEHIYMHNNFYGTSRAELKRITENDSIGILDIEILGYQALSKKITGFTSIFISPPSTETLRARLITRNMDSPKEIEDRLERAKVELKKKHLFQHNIINDKIDETYEKVETILLKMHRKNKI